MDNTRKLTARPIREGYIRTPDGPVNIWREYLWNTGEINKLALLADLDTPADEIIIREFDLPNEPTPT